MKNIIVLIFAFSFSSFLKAQCSGGLSGGVLTPTLNTSWQAQAVTGNMYYTFSAVAGSSYAFSFCQGGGFASNDTQLTILNAAGVSMGLSGYNDDSCGLQSEVSNWTAPTSGTYRILVNQYNCTTTSFAATLAYREVPPAGPGQTCSSAYAIPNLPFNQTGMTTCGYGDDFSSADACASSYMNGDDFVFTYTSPGNEEITINLTNTASYVGVFVTDNCPSTTGASCVAPSTGPACAGGGITNTSSTGNPSGTWALTNPGTYYITVSTWPAPQCSNFDIDITSSPISATTSTACYTVSSPTYAPDSYTAGTPVIFPDDQHSTDLPIGFDFCFMGGSYSRFIISSNGYISFNNMCGGTYSPWNTIAIPMTTYPEAANSIMGPWQDINPNIGGSINYAVYGSAPNRRLVVSYSAIPMFSSSCTGQTFTGQIVLHEGSNTIDNFIQNKPVCSTWNAGEAVQGLLDSTGTLAVAVAGRNNTQWLASNDSRRYTPTCDVCPVSLPVVITSIHGINEGSINRISWTTGEEKNLESFSIEKSQTAQENSFIEAERIPSQGSNSSYTIKDLAPWAVTYYRVVGIDLDSKKTYSNIIEVKAYEDDFSLGEITVQGSKLSFVVTGIFEDTPIEVTISSLLGQVVKKYSSLATQSGEMTFYLDGMSQGAYLVQVLARDKKFFKKFFYAGDK